MRVETLHEALRFHSAGDDLIVTLHLPGGHKLTGIPHAERRGMLSITPTSEDGTTYADDNGDVIFVDVADIVAVRAFTVS